MARRKKTLGHAFKDELDKVTFKSNKFHHIRDADWVDALLPNYHGVGRVGLENSYWRTTLFLSIVIIFFCLLLARLFHLQIVQGSQNRELADGNRILIKVLHAPRGVIFDRNGKILASNAPGFRLVDPVKKKTTYLTREEALEIESRKDPRAIQLEVDNIRAYPLKEELAHVTGYLGEISQEQMMDPQYKNYKLGDRIGKSGIEFEYEALLRGIDGGEIIEVDAGGKKLRTIRRILPVPGQNLFLTIDSDLQRQTYRSLAEGIDKAKSCCGAAIAMDPMNGQVLALVSIPSFDPNIFTDSQRSEMISDIFSQTNFPVLNRVITGTYPPGSTYKIVSAIAALESGKVTAKTEFEDTGKVSLGSYTFSNWYFTQYGRTEGAVDMVKALKRSNDTYFYQVGQKIGEAQLVDWSRKLYLGKKLGIDIDGEVSGLVPDNDWKLKNTKEEWYPGDTLHLSIGQGFLLTTPLQVLGITSYIAASGNLYKPQIFLKATRGETEVTKFYQPKLLVSNLISKEHVSVIKQGLEQVTKIGGTAWPFFYFPIPTAGKTGTAEFGDPKNLTHAWYTSYAPVNDPKIVLTVLVEGGGEGSSIASPIAKEIYRWYFSPDKNNLLKDLNVIATDSAKILDE